MREAQIQRPTENGWALNFGGVVPHLREPPCLTGEDTVGKIIYEYGSPRRVRLLPHTPYLLGTLGAPTSSATSVPDVPPARAGTTVFCFAGTNQLPSLHPWLHRHFPFWKIQCGPEHEHNVPTCEFWVCPCSRRSKKIMLPRVVH